VAVVLREAAASLEILFIRRAEDPRDPWSGQIAFPGGRAEPEDPSLEVTAVRETAEEVGLDLATAGECLGALDEVRALAKMRPLNLAIAPYVFRFAGSEVAEPRAEVKSVHWLPLDDLLSPERRSTMEYVHQGLCMEFPCLRVGELVIWGLTYRMLMGLRERLGLPAAGAGAAEAGARG
jgi:8-oxo-dGTP pyrophosphatase MutT (NUDIX family)